MRAHARLRTPACSDIDATARRVARLLLFHSTELTCTNSDNYPAPLPSDVHPVFQVRDHVASLLIAQVPADENLLLASVVNLHFTLPLSSAE